MPSFTKPTLGNLQYMKHWRQHSSNVWNEVPFPIFFGGFMLTFQGEHPFLLFLAGFFSIQSSSFSSTGIWGLIQQHGLHRFTLFGRQIWAGLVGNIFKKLATLEPRRQSTEFCFATVRHAYMLSYAAIDQLYFVMKTCLLNVWLLTKQISPRLQ